MRAFRKKTMVELTNGDKGVIPGIDTSDLQNLKHILEENPDLDKYGYAFHLLQEDGIMVQESRDVFFKEIKSILSSSQR